MNFGSMMGGSGGFDVSKVAGNLPIGNGGGNAQRKKKREGVRYRMQSPVSVPTQQQF